MLRSLNEITGEMRKAALGAGFPVGHAQELAEAAAWLVSKKQDGVNALLVAIQSGFAKVPPKIEFKPSPRGKKEFVLEKVSAASHGLALRDMIVADAGMHDFEVSAIDVPLLLFALFAVNEASNGNQFFWSLSEDEGAACIRNISPDALENAAMLLSSNSGPAILRFRTTSETNQSDENAGNSAIGGYSINETLWPEIKALAAKTYVPASEASRIKGAGAAINDND